MSLTKERSVLSPDPSSARAKPWDVVVTTVLVVVGAAIAVTFAMLGELLRTASANCGPSACNLEQMSLGVVVAMILPCIVAAAAIVWSVRRMRLHRRAFWVPLLGIFGSVLAWGLGAALVLSAVQGVSA